MEARQLPVAKEMEEKGVGGVPLSVVWRDGAGRKTESKFVQASLIGMWGKQSNEGRQGEEPVCSTGDECTCS